MKVRAKAKLLPHQLEYTFSKATFPALVGGFGCGKTESGIFRFLNQMKLYGPMLKKQNKVYTYGIYEPTYDLLNLILFPRIEQIFTLYNIEYKLNKSEKTIWIPRFNTFIICRSMQNPERIVGYQHYDAWCDELDTLKKHEADIVFTKIMERNRLDKPDGLPNTIGVTTTPEGYRFCYETWEKTGHPKEYVIIRGLTASNGFLSDSYIYNLKKKYPPNYLKAYLEGQFVNLNAATVYDMFEREKNNTKITMESLSNFNNEIHIGMDFNVGKMSAVVALINESDHEVLIVDEIFGAKDTFDMCRLINEKYANYGSKIFIYPDAAGNQRKTSATKTDIQVLQSNGFLTVAPSKNPLIKDRVMALNAMFENGLGEVRLFVNNEKCPILTENLEQQSYDEKTGQPDKTRDQDHMNDALGYLINMTYPIKRQLILDS